MNLRRIFFWILFIFTLVIVYKNWFGPILETISRDNDVEQAIKFPKSYGMAIPLLIYFVWRIFKWSKPGRVEEERIEKERIEKERIGKNGYTKLMYLSGYGDIHEIKNQLSQSSADINAQDKGGY